MTRFIARRRAATSAGEKDDILLFLGLALAKGLIVSDTFGRAWRRGVTDVMMVSDIGTQSRLQDAMRQQAFKPEVQDWLSTAYDPAYIARNGANAASALAFSAGKSVERRKAADCFTAVAASTPA